MTAKRHFVVLLSVLTLMPCWTKLAAEPLIFFFSGQITERRAQNSIFTEPNTDQFYGYFSYDTTATIGPYNLYPLLSFSVNGNSLNFTNETSFSGTPGVLVAHGGWTGTGGTFEIHGFYPPATPTNPPGFDDSLSIVFYDSSGLLFTNYALPTSLSLSWFDYARLQGPTVFQPQPGFTADEGTITQLIQVPEPASRGLLGLGLLAVCCRKRRHILWHWLVLVGYGKGGRQR